MRNRLHQPKNGEKNVRFAPKELKKEEEKCAAASEKDEKNRSIHQKIEKRGKKVEKKLALKVEF